MYSNSAVLFSFGVGGHTSQAHRLAKILISDLNDIDIITISDLKKQPEWSKRHYVTGEFREKSSHLQILTNTGPFKIISTLLKIRRENQVKCVVSTGPGLSILVSLFFKLQGAKVIHIETWSRFKTQSLTGKFMYKIADRFYIQHRSLQSIYPKGIYSGVL
ncbi:PssD/Cps14F family polysaccharide biosynthesis glycosyltransferase [Vibrio cholerae]|uniref:PssD/Cps14F family polysaccharide biosynthesis glycosyltransferase n=1 Tax=Vibrio cholerae TaxID=666 RepID=UPI0022AFE213|nr:PssD/Cps14F family polysaccharide biosynthesis glycosyltransferase [Vibrio cholerae]EJX1708280.1 polysaccharide biosynthesis protein [Vibrio cholerae]